MPIPDFQSLMLPTPRAVGEGALRNFAGAIDAAGTTKGVFVTTSSFTASAREYVRVSPKRIVLIDGPELARLLVSHDVGVRTTTVHKIKRVDEDYFAAEDLWQPNSARVPHKWVWSAGQPAWPSRLCNSRSAARLDSQCRRSVQSVNDSHSTHECSGDNLIRTPPAFTAKQYSGISDRSGGQ